VSAAAPSAPRTSPIAAASAPTSARAATGELRAAIGAAKACEIALGARLAPAAERSGELELEVRAASRRPSLFASTI
jgi:hypothetical protein